MPRGEEFFEWIFSKDKLKESLTIQLYKSDKEFDSFETYKIIPEYLEVLYKVSTCAYGCKGGSHVIEYITGRGYNLGIASMKLLRLGLYDESISLIRSISEIVNLFALFAIEPNSLNEWYTHTERDRIRNFSPAKVRKRISLTTLDAPISRDYYSKMCEVGVHVNPSTRPQGHNKLDRGLVGGFVQEEQAIAIQNDLANNLSWLVIMSLRNSVDKEIFIEETTRLKPLVEKIGNLSLESIEEHLKNKTES